MSLRMLLPGSDHPASATFHSGQQRRTCSCGRPILAGGECTVCRRRHEQAAVSTAADAAETHPDSAPPMFGSHVFGERAAAAPKGGHDFTIAAMHASIRGPGHFAARPGKAQGESYDLRDEAKPNPATGSATIQCNGSGGWEIVYGGWDTAACGTKSCVTAHESSHMADWQAKWPGGCTGQAKGYLPKGDPPDNPLMTAAEYNTFLKASECRAHTADLTCAEALPQAAPCEKTVKDYIALTRTQKAAWCP